ncbi:MAG: lipoprotein intramolecular transacylase Lit [Candidatus Limnocylindrales bacterium]
MTSALAASAVSDTTLARRVESVVVGLATALTILGAVVLLLISPLYLQPALESAGSADYLTAGGVPVDAAGAQALSDRTVRELFAGPGSFAWTAAEAVCPTDPSGCGALDASRPFYDPAEASHLRDARTVLYGFLLVVGLSVVGLVIGLVRARRERWFGRSVSRGAAGLAVVLGVIGVFSAVAFDQAFTLFHEVFFPGGNWSFDPLTQHLVQLYPIPFWELTSTVLVGLAVVGGALVWWLARREARGLEGRP